LGSKELIKLLETKYKSSKGFMGVQFSGVKSPEDLFENVKDEIFTMTEVIEESDVEAEFGMTVSEARGYVKKLRNFLIKYE
jgi:hypothetical protein